MKVRLIQLGRDIREIRTSIGTKDLFNLGWVMGIIKKESNGFRRSSF
jgi:hypothetical protein